MCFFFAVNFQYNQSPLAVAEPGIGLWLIYSVLQFLLFNFLIYLLEARPWSNIDLRKMLGRVNNNENDSFENVSVTTVNIYIFV